MKSFLIVAFVFLALPVLAQEAQVQPPAEAPVVIEGQTAEPAAEAVIEETPVAAPVINKPEPAAKAARNSPDGPIAYDRWQRFNRPIDTVVEYRHAQNVVMLDVPYNDLPETIRADLEQTLAACPEAKDDLGYIKAYSYVSDGIRSKNLSPNYFLDFSEFASKPTARCSAVPLCTDDGCLLTAYHAYGYKEWRTNLSLYSPGWTLRKVDDQSANPIPQAKKPTILFVFDMNTKCSDEEKDESCHGYRLWLSGGLGSYTLPKDHK
ncbi:MAG: hypothetical protein EB059_09570 [Alphaproteobacteria bacterium]|nr:hypothetical protein [Alphaproteobacteria bacterium]